MFPGVFSGVYPIRKQLIGPGDIPAGLVSRLEKKGASEIQYGTVVRHCIRYSPG